MITEPIASFYFRTSQRWMNENLNIQFDMPISGSLSQSQNNQEELVCTKRTPYSSFVIPIVRLKNK